MNDEYKIEKRAGLGYRGYYYPEGSAVRAVELFSFTYKGAVVKIVKTFRKRLDSYGYVKSTLIPRVE